MSFRIGFLLNHDAAHQAAHSVPVALALTERGEHDIVILVSTQAEAAVAADLLGTDSKGHARIEHLQVPTYLRMLDALTGRALALKRVGLIWHYRRHLAEFDALVAAEKTSALLKSWLGRDCPRLINIRHGAGDRACGNFGRKMSRFDLQLLPGRKYERLFLESADPHDDAYAVTGYPKLEHCASRPRPRLFDNDRPVVVYAPHFDPLSSSWYKWGHDILRFFAASDDYNLIFAPHVLLFARRWHVPGAGGRPRMTGSIPDFARQAGNILVDPESEALLDMSYMRAADIYLGDVSSQIYEFLYRPRPCIFLNPGQVSWQDDPRYLFWRCGRVIDDLAALPEALGRAQDDHQHFLPRQKQAFEDTFSITDEPASERSADAIVAFLERAHSSAATARAG